MDELNLETLLEDHGYIIKEGESARFIREADNVNISELVDRLSNLEKKINSGSNIVDFAKNIIGKLDEIEKTVNDDEYARLSDAEQIARFNDSLNAMRYRFAKVKNYIRAEENMKFQKQNMFEYMRKIYELDKNKTLDAASRTKETLRLYKNKKACEEAYNKAVSFYNEQKRIYNESVKGFSLTDFKNELLKEINALQDSYRNLALSSENKDRLQVLVADTRENIAMYGLESIKSKSEYDSLCNKFGIAKEDAKIQKRSQTSERLISENMSRTDNEELKIEKEQQKQAVELKESVSQENIKAEENQNFFAKAKNAINKLAQDGRVEANKKYAVKKSRTAIIGSYPKSLLTFAAIGAICGGLSASPVLITTAIGAGLGAFVNKLYRKITKDTDVKVDELENVERKSLVGEQLSKIGNKLLEIYRKRKTGEIKANEEEFEFSLDDIDSLDNSIQDAMHNYQEKQESILLDDETPSRNGRKI